MDVKLGSELFEYEHDDGKIELVQDQWLECDKCKEVFMENVNLMLPIARTAIGSVEGTLEGVNIHGKHPKFIVYHNITKKAVTCSIDDREKIIDLGANYLGKEVSVFGTLHKNIKGDTLRVAMERILLLNKENRFALPSKKEFTDPEFTKAKSTKEYLRLIRG